MRLLILGGTAWLGRCVADTALRLGDEVTCLARGLSGETAVGAVLVRADRTRPDAYERVAEGSWDVVVDVTRHPGQVRGAVAALADRTRLFVFVSSGNVYADHSFPGQDETGELVAALDRDVMESMESYGPAKVACEQLVRQGFGQERALIARVGLIGGPGDVFDRTGYWPLRFARPPSEDGAVLVPNAPQLPTQVIDVRDLAAWIVDASGRGLVGTFNVTGPTMTPSTWRSHAQSPDTMGGWSAPTRTGCSRTACRSGWASARCPCGLPTPIGLVSTPGTAAGREAPD
jgi:2'-hydroxyisoflavone reductase